MIVRGYKIEPGANLRGQTLGEQTLGARTSEGANLKGAKVYRRDLKHLIG